MSIERIANYKAKADIDDQATVLKAKLLKSAKLRLENVMKYNVRVKPRDSMLMISRITSPGLVRNWMTLSGQVSSNVKRMPI